MKGPKLVKYYSCEHCEDNYPITINVSRCYINDKQRDWKIWNYKTPKECPFLLKEIRKEKLYIINES